MAAWPDFLSCLRVQDSLSIVITQAICFYPSADCLFHLSMCFVFSFASDMVKVLLLVLFHYWNTELL